jgi:aryl-alcohol dehydrogenase-like predicted oxidoreductase
LRYRPFGRSGVVTSCVALSITDAAARRGPDALRGLIYTALENGINAYHVTGHDPEILAVVGQALSQVERRLIFVSLRLGMSRGRVGVVRDFSPEGLTATIDASLHASGLGHIDLVTLDEPAADELPRPSLECLKAQRAAGRVNLIGIAGGHDAMDAYLSSNNFDVVATPFHLRAGSKERNRLKAAAELDMGVMAYGWFPEEFATQKSTEQASGLRRGLFGSRPAEAHPLQGVGTYAFLHQTKNWTAEELCLAYCLTETSVSTVLVHTADPTHLAQLASVPDRELPPGVSAQIEMARFGAPPSEQRAG